MAIKGPPLTCGIMTTSSELLQVYSYTGQYTEPVKGLYRHVYDAAQGEDDARANNIKAFFAGKRV